MITRKGITLGKGKPLVCVPVVERDMDGILGRIRSLAESGADMIEWRADFFDRLDDMDAVRQLLDRAGQYLDDCLLLFTTRSRHQGGQSGLGERTVGNLQAMAAGHEAVDLVDVEYLECSRPEKHLRRLKKQDCIIVASHHDFSRTPELPLLRQLLLHMYEDGADIAKLAVMPQEETDVIRLLELTASIHRERPEDLLVTMSMGGIGSISRICGEVFGSCITFGSVGTASAPGQIEAEKLEDLLDVIHESLMAD